MITREGKPEATQAGYSAALHRQLPLGQPACEIQCICDAGLLDAAVAA